MSVGFLHLGIVELFWFFFVIVSMVWTTWGLREATIAHSRIKKLNGRAREITAAGNIRREVVRLTAQVLLFLLAVPEAFSDRDILLTPALLVLILLPPVLLLNTIGDTIDTKQLIGIVDAELVSERRKSQERLEKTAAASFALAEETNERVKVLEDLVVPRGKETDDHTADLANVTDLAIDTNERVQDIQERIPQSE